MIQRLIKIKELQEKRLRSNCARLVYQQKQQCADLASSKEGMVELLKSWQQIMDWSGVLTLSQNYQQQRKIKNFFAKEREEISYQENLKKKIEQLKAEHKQLLLKLHIVIKKLEKLRILLANESN